MKATIALDELSVAVPADRRAAIAIGSAGLLTDVAIRAGVAVVAGSVLALTVAAFMIASGRLRTSQSRIAVAAAPVFGLWLSVRQSPWVLLPDIAAIAGLLTLGAVFAREGDVRASTGPRLVMRLATALRHGLCAPAFAWEAMRPRGDSRSKLAPVARGVLLAVPLIGILALLLSAADPVFASMFHINVDAGPAMHHVVLVIMGMWGMAGLLATSSAPMFEAHRVHPRLGRTEAILLLIALDVLFGLFALAQILALSGAGRRILETQGLSYAQYARSGFFQLLAVAAITLAALAAVRALTDRTRALTALSICAIAGTLGVVLVAIRRLAMYDHAYGLTMLRLYAAVIAVWIAVAFILLATAMLRDAQWFVPAAAGAALVIVLALNVVNPEAYVARRNLARAAPFDADYVASLSADAAPVVAAHLDQVPVGTLDRMCGETRVSWVSYNRATATCMHVRRQIKRDVSK